MAELYIKGWITNDNYHNIGISDISPEERKNDFLYTGDSIVDMIESFASEHGIFGRHKKGLGGRKSYIDDCSLRIFFTDKESTLEEAMEAFDELLYGGDVKTRMDLVGYSEYTIEGIDLVEFSIGGHDLNSEISYHHDEYMHFILEV